MPDAQLTPIGKPMHNVLNTGWYETECESDENSSCVSPTDDRFDHEEKSKPSNTTHTRLTASGEPIANASNTERYEIDRESAEEDTFPSPPYSDIGEEYYVHLDTEEKRKTRFIPFPNNIGYILDKSGVPNVLFSSHIFEGRVTELRKGKGTDFVIPDDHMKNALAALCNYGFEPCRDKHCEYFDPASRLCTASVHFDKDPPGHYGPIALYPKSRMLWWMKDWTVDRPTTIDPLFTISDWFNTPIWGGGTGGIPPKASVDGDGYPVRLLDLDALTQAVMFLYCRDYKETDGYQHWWKPLLVALADVRDYQVDNDGDRPERTIGGFAKAFWTGFISPRRNAGRKDLDWKQMPALREVLVRHDYLPPAVLPNSCPLLESGCKGLASE